jgi:hypothetical protein
MRRAIVGQRVSWWRACRRRRRMCSRPQHVAPCCRATSPRPPRRRASARQPRPPRSNPPAPTCSTPSRSPRSATSPTEPGPSATVRRSLLSSPIPRQRSAPRVQLNSMAVRSAGLSETYVALNTGHAFLQALPSLEVNEQ